VAYLTTSQAATRLASYGITASVSAGDLIVASEELDALGPWISQKKESNQGPAFPRSLLLDGTENTEGIVPEVILDAVALLAYHIGTDEDPAITSESILDRSVTYSIPKENIHTRRITALIRPYQLRVGSRL
jgi:hypothetical protein